MTSTFAPWYRDMPLWFAVTVSAFLLFARLGHYAVWDDEAMVALVAKGVRKTGDTSAMLDHNIVAYRNGSLLVDGKDRSTPPLATYLTAGVQSLFGESPAALRTPFAVCGLAAIALLLVAARDLGAPLGFRWLAAGALIGNVALFLYCRQCRYYAVGILATVAVGWLYLRWRGGRRGALALAGAFTVLFAANYLWALVLAVCLALDWLLWRRHELRPALSSLLPSALPAALICGAVAAVWNPFRTSFSALVEKNTLTDRLTLLWWNFRDLNNAEQLVGGLALLAAVMAVRLRHRWLARGLTCLVAYTVLVTVVSPQLVSVTRVADVRYLAAIIPLGCLICAGAVYVLAGRMPLVAAGLAVVGFGTTLFQGGPLIQAGLRSTPLAFLGEIASPPGEPYTPAAAWIRDHVKARESVWVTPDYMAYPLMYHAPDPVYAWQLAPSEKTRFPQLPAIHFQGQQPPDYIIVFGPSVREVAPMIQNWSSQGVRYEHVTTIPRFWKDLYRPEVFWRSFKPISGYHPQLEAINVFRLIKAAPSEAAKVDQ